MSGPSLFLISSLDSLRQHKLALKLNDQFIKIGLLRNRFYIKRYDTGLAAEIQYLSLHLQYKQDIFKTTTRIHYLLSNPVRGIVKLLKEGSIVKT